jgi:hypothetical protein
VMQGDLGVKEKKDLLELKVNQLKHGEVGE